MLVPTKSMLPLEIRAARKLVAILWADYRITIFPRSKYNLFEYETDSTGKRKTPEKVKKTDPLLKYLEGFKGDTGKIKDIEKRMYLDLCRKFPADGTVYYCFKKITVYIEKDEGDNLNWQPFDPGPYRQNELDENENDDEKTKFHKLSCKAEEKDLKRIEVKLVSGSNRTRFFHINRLEERLDTGCRSFVDRNGVVELIIAHPAEEVAAGDRKIKIKIIIKNSKNKELVDSEYEFELVRNNWKVTALDKIGKRGTDEKADHLLIHQPANPETENNAVKDLQKICNQVVSRNQKIANYAFPAENGVYNNATRDAIKQYINGFKHIRKGTDENKDYPYSLECMGDTGIDRELAKHITDEYGIVYANNPGIVVDRNLLIGKKHSKELADTDGLADLYENVVKQYIAKVVNISEVYRTSADAWFHDPAKSIHFKMGDVTLEENKYQYTTAAGNTYRKKTVNNQQVPDLINTGTIISHTNFQTHKENNVGRFNITHNGNSVWITLTDHEWENRDDRNIPENKGNRGAVFNGYDYTNYGVPYCLGGKNNLDKFRERLSGMSDDMKNWNQYPANDYVDADGYSAWPNNGKIVGLDCNGFVQNCITHIYFDERVDGKNYRIVPNTLISVYQYRTHNGINNVPGASPAGDMLSTALTTGGKAYASGITIDTAAASITDRRNLMTRGDVIVRRGAGGGGSGHIVLVTVPDGNFPCAADRNNKNFAITHNYGCTFIYTGNQAPSPATNNSSYYRKTIKSPFSAWGIGWSSVYIGRIMLWK